MIYFIGKIYFIIHIPAHFLLIDRKLVLLSTLHGVTVKVKHLIQNLTSNLKDDIDMNNNDREPGLRQEMKA